MVANGHRPSGSPERLAPGTQPCRACRGAGALPTISATGTPGDRPVLADPFYLPRATGTAAGAARLSGLFRLPARAGCDPCYPWIQGRSGVVGQHSCLAGRQTGDRVRRPGPGRYRQLHRGAGGLAGSCPWLCWRDSIRRAEPAYAPNTKAIITGIKPSANSVLSRVVPAACLGAASSKVAITTVLAAIGVMEIRKMA